MCKCRAAELTSHYNRKQNLYQRTVWKSAKLQMVRDYRIDEQFQNLLFLGILIMFQIKKKI